MFRDKGQRTNEVHVKHVTTFTFAAHAALAADKALNHPSALAELQPVGIDDDEGERSCVLLACFARKQCMGRPRAPRAGLRAAAATHCRAGLLAANVLLACCPACSRASCLPPVHQTEPAFA